MHAQEERCKDSPSHVAYMIQKSEATDVSINSKLSCVFMHGKVLSMKLNKLQLHKAGNSFKRKKQDAEEYIQNNFIYIKFKTSKTKL